MVPVTKNEVMFSTREDSALVIKKSQPPPDPPLTHPQQQMPGIPREAPICPQSRYLKFPLYGDKLETPKTSVDLDD